MNFLERIVSKKNTNLLFRVGLHLLFWLLYWLTAYYFNTVSLNIFAGTFIAWLEPLLNVFNLVLFYYPFVYFIWPLLLKNKKYVTGVLLLLIQILIYTILFEVQERWLITNCSSCKELLSQMPAVVRQGTKEPLLQGIASSLFSLGIFYVLIARLSPVIAFKIAFDFIKARTNAMELEKENILLEFRFLKAQVNPHFLFNTLNNIHSLVVQERKDEASATIARLSDFLRHSLYESGGESISIGKELELMEDYIALEKLRLNKTMVTMVAAVPQNEIRLPPLLFIPLVENAFKYSADNLEGHSFIDISIELVNHRLCFQIRNNYDPLKRNQNGGIGWSNLKKRLQSQYPGKHQVSLSDQEKIYDVKITIDL